MNIRFCGFGGQGILVAGRILGMAAMSSGRKAIQNQSYGSASRGGTCYSDVTISDSEIYELEPENFDIMIALSQQACDKFLPELKDGGLLLYDSDLVRPDESRLGKLTAQSIGATEHAHHEYGRDILANIIMIGLLNGISSVLPDDILEETISSVVPPSTRDINLEAYRYGLKAASNATNT